MVMWQEDNVCGDFMSHAGCFMKEFSSNAQGKKSTNFNDFKSEGCEDVIDLLPNDPFGMEFNISLPNDPFGMDFNLEATVVSFSGWMEEFVSNAYGLDADEVSKDNFCEDNNISAELNFTWTGPMNYGQKDGEDNVVVDTCSWMHSHDEHNMLSGDVKEVIFFGCEKYQSGLANDCNYDGEGGAPSDALTYALGYLSISDLLSVERVCKSLRDDVRDNPLLWRNIHIDYPLNDKISDDDLLRLTSRAQGTLCSLSLMKCHKITNDGLRHVLESNLGLNKLSVPGCMKIKVEGLLHDLKVFNSVANPGIKQLRIGSLSGLTYQHFKEFKLLLAAEEDAKSNNCKPRFYRIGERYLPLDDDHVIDIETCPLCLLARLVYDCPGESCQVKALSDKACRGCLSCIPRCVNCGCCLDNKAYEETFSLDLLCFDCLAQLLDGRDRVALSPRSACFHQKTSYRYMLYS